MLSQWDFSHRNFGLLSLGKGGCDSHATQPTVRAGRFSVSIIHWILTWSMGTLTCAQTLMYAIAHRGCTQRCMDTCKRVCTESWLWQKNPLLHWGTEPASAAWWSNALPMSYIPIPQVSFSETKTGVRCNQTQDTDNSFAVSKDTSSCMNLSTCLWLLLNDRQRANKKLWMQVKTIFPSYLSGTWPTSKFFM